MTLDRGLAIAGVILGLPGVLVLVLSSSQTLAIINGILAVLLLGAAYFIKYILDAAPFNVKDVTVILSFPQDHKKAILRKHYKMYANFNHLKQIEHKNIAADGKIENICWNKTPVPADHIKNVLGEYEVYIDLPFDLPRWKEFSGTLSYECIDSFNADTEAFMYCVDFPTRLATIIIAFPKSRPCRSTEATKVQGAGAMPIAAPRLSPDGRRLVLKLKYPTIGAQYIIYWNW
jgi:hypothetical protein